MSLGHSGANATKALSPSALTCALLTIACGAKIGPRAERALLRTSMRKEPAQGAARLSLLAYFGRPPFHGSNEAEVLARVKQGKVSFEAKEWNYVSVQMCVYIYIYIIERETCLFIY